jgi:hypothetical protein
VAARAAGIGTALGALALSACATGPAPSAACDRDCLAGLITAYVDALAVHDPSRLPLTDDVRFTEDSHDLALGEGLWTAITEVGAFRQDYLDTDKQIAASHLHLYEGDTQVMLSVLLHVEGDAIAGIETLVQRVPPEGRFQPTMLGQPLAEMNVPVPEGARGSREDMIRTALTYTEGLRIGTFVNTTPFAPEAYRIENGVFMAGAGCPRETCPDIQTQDIIEHPDVVASVAAVDEANGAVLLWMNFGDTNSYGEGNALMTFEAFKTWGGQIHAVNAFFRIVPVETERNWPSADPLPEG